MRSLLALMLLLACACGGGRPRGPMSDAERMYLAKCTSCHSAYEPSSRTPGAWVEAVNQMEAKKKIHLSQEERALVLGWLAGNSTAAGSNPAASKR